MVTVFHHAQKTAEEDEEEDMGNIASAGILAGIVVAVAYYNLPIDCSRNMVVDIQEMHHNALADVDKIHSHKVNSYLQFLLVGMKIQDSCFFVLDQNQYLTTVFILYWKTQTHTVSSVNIIFIAITLIPMGERITVVIYLKRTGFGRYYS